MNNPGVEGPTAVFLQGANVSTCAPPGELNYDETLKCKICPSSLCSRVYLSL